MTGLDGFTQATQKVAQDKGLAFDMLMEKFPKGVLKLLKMAPGRPMGPARGWSDKCRDSTPGK